MRKYLGLLFLLLMLNGCDDGDIKVDAINFDGVTAVNCPGGEIIYKLKENEALFIKLPASLDAFRNELTPVGSPRPYTIGGNIIVKYRGYNGNVTSDNLCPNVIQPIFPVATIEWTAVAGTIEITTTPVMSTPDAVTGATKLVSYNHNIVFKNIIFVKADGQQVYDEFVFGDYTTAATSLPLNFPSTNVHLCPSGTTLYNAIDQAREGMYIENIDPTLFSITDLGPKSRPITSTTHKLSYRLLTAALPTGTNDSYFCSAPLPTVPAVNQEWIAESGTIEVTTTSSSSGFHKHFIHLKGVTFRKGDVTFYYGDDILWGELDLPD